MSLKDLEKKLKERDEKIAELEAKIEKLLKENERLRGLLGDKAKAKASKTPKFSENYSAGKQGQQTQRGRGKAATGRRPQADKQMLGWGN